MDSDKAGLVPASPFPGHDQVTARALMEILDNSCRYASLVARYPDIPLLRERLSNSLDTLLMVLEAANSKNDPEKNSGTRTATA
jgi:hypothetical protein